MNSRRFPKLVVLLTSAFVDTAGLIPTDQFDLASICDDDLIPGTKSSTLLADAVLDLRREAFAIASAELKFSGNPRSGPFLAVLPRLDEGDYSLILSWKGANGTSYIAATEALPYLHQADAEYAGYDPAGRIIYLEDGIQSQ